MTHIIGITALLIVITEKGSIIINISLQFYTNSV